MSVLLVVQCHLFKLYFVHKQKFLKQHEYEKENTVKEGLGLGFFLGCLVGFFKTACNLTGARYNFLDKQKTTALSNGFQKPPANSGVLKLFRTLSQELLCNSNLRKTLLEIFK